MKKIILTAALFCTPQMAQAQSGCTAYTGTTVQPQTFDQAIASIKPVAPKDEFETSDAYRARLAAAGGSEVERLLPFEDAMDPNHRTAFQEQKAIIREVRRKGGPPQRQVVIPAPLQALFDQRRGAPREVEPRKKVGRNEKCPCGSGNKFKICHGR